MERALETDPERAERALGLHFVEERVATDDVRNHQEEEVKIIIFFLHQLFRKSVWSYCCCSF